MTPPWSRRDPTGQYDPLADIGGAESVAVMGAIHGGSGGVSVWAKGGIAQESLAGRGLERMRLFLTAQQRGRFAIDLRVVDPARPQIKFVDQNL